MESEEIWMDLHALHRHGWSISALARKFHLNRRTVTRQLEAAEPRRYPQRAAQHPLTPAQLAHVERRLAVCPSVRATDLHYELQTEYGYAGSYWTCRRQLAPLRPAILVEPEVRFETAAGVQTQAVADQANAATDDQVKTGHLRSVVMVASVGFVGQVLQ